MSTPGPALAGGLDPASAASASRRTRLRDYQAQLLARMQAASGGAGAAPSQLGLEIGARRYLVELAEAGEIVPLAPPTPVPLTQPWYLGLVNVRGNLTGVIDFARYLDGESGEAPAAAPGARLVTIAPALGVNAALLVSRVHGLRQAGAMMAEDGRLRDGEGNEWTPLSLAALVREERFLHIGI